MLRELRTSQLIEYKKLLNIVLDGINSSIIIRQGLIEYDSVSKYEHAKYDSLNDPEPYYHVKMFDKAIGIVRLYNPKEWFSDDQDKKYFHFGIRCYNFTPHKDFDFPLKRTDKYSTYGDFQAIEDCIKYFYAFVQDLLINTYKINVDLFEGIY